MLNPHQIYWNNDVVSAPELSDQDLSTEWQSPSPVQQDDQFKIRFDSPVNVGTVSFVPGSTAKVHFQIATGNNASYQTNKPVTSFSPLYEIGHGSSIVIDYSILWITIKMIESSAEPFSLREIMVFEELHLGLD